MTNFCTTVQVNLSFIAKLDHADTIKTPGDLRKRKKFA